MAVQNVLSRVQAKGCVFGSLRDTPDTGDNPGKRTHALQISRGALMPGLFIGGRNMGVLRKNCKTPGCTNLHRNPSGYCDVCGARLQEARLKELRATAPPKSQRKKKPQRDRDKEFEGRYGVI